MEREAGSTDQTHKPRLLLHTCCGPCATAVVERLRGSYDITCFFYNPNIHPEAEYGLRLDQAREFARHEGIRFIDDEYDAGEWFKETSGLEEEPEGGRRCAICFKKRLDRTARRAQEMGMDLFATTLAVSPHKDAALINEIGQSLSREGGPKFLSGDWKKKDGYKRSVELSRELGLVRQNYCGCKYSRMRT